jgi:hypothetical protein
MKLNSYAKMVDQALELPAKNLPSELFACNFKSVHCKIWTMMMIICILLQELNQDCEICATDDDYSYTMFACPHMNPKISITTPSSGVYTKNSEFPQLRMQNFYN